MFRKIITVPATIILLLLQNSCIGDTILHEYKHIDRDGWGRKDTLSFNIHNINTCGTLAFSTKLRTHASFQLKGVWVVRKLTLHNPEYSTTDTLYIYTQNNGILQKGSGITITTFSQTDTLDCIKKGQYGTLQLYHVMSKEYLLGIQDIGACIEYCK